MTSNSIALIELLCHLYQELFSTMNIDFHFILTLVISFAISTSIWFLFERVRKSGDCCKIPGEYGYIWIGEVLEYFNNPVEFTKKRFFKHGRIFRSMFFGQNVVFVKGNRAIELFSTGTDGGLSACTEAFMFDYLLYAFNAARRRSMLMSESDHQHSFKHLAMLSAITMVHNQPGLYDIRIRTIMLDRMSHIASTSSGKPVSGTSICRDVFLHIVVFVLLRQLPDKGKLMELMETWFNMHAAMPFSFLGMTAWDKGLRAKVELDTIITEEVRSRVQSQGRDMGDDLIGCMLKAAERRASANGSMGKTMHGIIEKTALTDIWLFLHSVAVSTASAASWLLVALEQCPSIKQALITEVRNYTTELDLRTLEKSTNLPYIDATVEEVLRVYGCLECPNQRRVAMFDIDFEGTCIPKGTPVFLSLSSLNFEEDYFPKASIFDPLRYLPGGENYASGGSYTFGLGHHACPGAVFVRVLLKLFVFSILERFDFTADPNQSYAPSYPRKWGLFTNSGKSKVDRLKYYPVPEDRMMYTLFTERPVVSSSGIQNM